MRCLWSAEFSYLHVRFHIFFYADNTGCEKLCLKCENIAKHSSGTPHCFCFAQFRVVQYKDTLVISIYCLPGETEQVDNVRASTPCSESPSCDQKPSWEYPTAFGAPAVLNSVPAFQHRQKKTIDKRIQGWDTHIPLLQNFDHCPLMKQANSCSLQRRLMLWSLLFQTNSQGTQRTWKDTCFHD